MRGIALISLVALVGCGDPDPIDPGCCDAGPDDRVDAGSIERDAGGCLECEHVDPFAVLADPLGPAQRLPGEARLATSREPEAPEAYGNRDWSNFVAREGNESVLLDARGAGWIARLWFTLKDLENDRSVSDRARLRVHVDGALVVDDTLAALTSGDDPAFPRPWVAGRALASGAHVIYVPIAFAESIRVTLEHDETWQNYYQVDWHLLPEGTSVTRAFDGTLDARERALLADATALWIDHAIAAPEMEARPFDLAAGAMESVRLDGAGVVRRVEISLDEGDAADLAVAWIVDGETIADAPIGEWMAADDPAADHEAAFGGRDGALRAFHLPAPFRSSSELVLRATGSTPLRGEVLLEHQPAPSGATSLGALRITCTANSDMETDTNVTLAAIDGVRGQYAGQILVAHGSGGGWWMMEGDHEVAVDGEWTLMGTGLEDYFGGSFYFLDGVFTLGLSGAPGFDLHGLDHLVAPIIDVSMYRYHVLDAVPFDGSFAFEFENTHPGTVFESCVYWYEHSSSP